MQLKATNKYYEEKKNKLLVDLLDIREEVKLLVEIKDILDEINIILSVLDIQRTVIKQRRKAEGLTFLGSSAAEVLIKADIDDFKKLEGHSRTIQEKINTLMDLKQKAANAWEAREARETTVAASKQGNVGKPRVVPFLPAYYL
ncbi:hypothetical protein J4E85_007376 [Alternaria conjuncta]|uniref:uncharacterized protein n=1 Tax=Alternaria conjuncta TaxID=181017 RepID=UPI00221F2468|nr:uncharacterized protein J4E85_007376 [Alternaria conjuncta]KAI4925497.1 hypothetical protein J4E85_007376 [Alternaria conjuncta]